MKPSVRQAVALVASASSNGVFLDGPCTIPRTVIVDQIAGFVENGVACDIMTSGMADVVAATDPSDEVFNLSALQAQKVVGLVGLRKCIDLGVIAADRIAN